MTSSIMDCPGSITVEYYDDSTDFDSENSADSDEHDNISECPSELIIGSGAGRGGDDAPQEEEENEETSSSCSRCSSRQNMFRQESFGTYDFVHTSEPEVFEEEEEMCIRRRSQRETRFFKEVAREAMDHHYTITQQERVRSLLLPRQQVGACPRGDKPGYEGYARRRVPGPFLTCPFAQSHACGDEFSQVQLNICPKPDVDTWQRPPHIKDKTNKAYKPCKHCEHTAFTHHRNPAQHYEDYVNSVTYKRHQHQTKIWPQHLVDLKHSLTEQDKEDEDYQVISDKCKMYKPSLTISNKYPYQMRWRRPAFTPRKTTYLRPPSFRRNKPVADTATEETASEVKPTVAMADKTNNNADKPTTTKLAGLPTTAKQPTSKMDQVTTQRVNKIHRPSTAFQQRLNASVAARLIKSRRVQHAPLTKSTRFVAHKRKPNKRAQAEYDGAYHHATTSIKKGSTVAKYIQKGKPNISAKLLRARSKAVTTKHNIKGESRTPIIKVIKKAPERQGKHVTSKNSSSIKPVSDENGSSEENSFTLMNSPSQSQKESISDEDGSFAQFRDQNGDFDTEKYRQSVLKMLAKNSTTGARLKGKKKQKSKRNLATGQLGPDGLVSLPEIKNRYSDTKPRIVTNAPKRNKALAKKKSSKSKKVNAAFTELIKRISEVSLKHRRNRVSTSDTNVDTDGDHDKDGDQVDRKESYFSIPHLIFKNL